MVPAHIFPPCVCRPPSPHTGPWNRAFFSSMAPGLYRVELDPKPAAAKLDPDPTFQIIKEKMQI